MPDVHEVTIKVTGVPGVKAAMAEAVAAERRRLVHLVRATCACQQCKDSVAELLKNDEVA